MVLLLGESPDTSLFQACFLPISSRDVLPPATLQAAPRHNLPDFLPGPFSSAALPSPPVIQVTKPFSFVLAQLPISTQKGEVRSEQTNRQQEVMFPGFAEGSLLLGARTSPHPL